MVCSIEGQYLKIYCLEKRVEHFSLNTTQDIHHFHQYTLQSDHPFLKYRIQSLTIDSPQNCLDSGQEFIRFVELTSLKHFIQIEGKLEVRGPRSVE
jgi:hypothetical protein